MKFIIQWVECPQNKHNVPNTESCFGSQIPISANCCLLKNINNEKERDGSAPPPLLHTIEISFSVSIKVYINVYKEINLCIERKRDFVSRVSDNYKLELHMLSFNSFLLRFLDWTSQKRQLD